MHKLFTIHDFSHFCPFLQLSTVSFKLISRWDMDLTICDLFYYIAFLENQVSKNLRHSQLNQHHLDCLWSWTSLHSFLLQVFPN